MRSTFWANVRGELALQSDHQKKHAISKSTAQELSETFSSLPITVTIRYLDTSNVELRQAVEAYKKLGDYIRLKIRGKSELGIRERKIPQILHSHILYHCLLGPLMDLIDHDFPLFIVRLFIDAWPIPAHDRAVYLAEIGWSLQKNVNRLMAKSNKPGYVSLDHVSTMHSGIYHRTEYRKRLIDVITSVVNGSNHFQSSHIGPKDPIAILESGLRKSVSKEDITMEVYNFYIEYREEFLGE